MLSVVYAGKDKKRSPPADHVGIYTVRQWTGMFYTTSAGSGSYGNVIGYSVNAGKSISEIYFPPIAENPKANKGYMGHDEFAIVETSLVQRFKIYKEGDTNSKPTGNM